MLAVVVTAATVGVLLPATAAQAFAKPLTDWSFYMRPVGTGEASTLGCNQGQFDAANGNIDSEVVLDFGGQAANGQGTLLAKGNNEFISYAAIEATAEAYAASYFNSTGSDVTSVVYLNLGTNNSAYFVNAAGGAAWAKVVNDVQAWVDANAGQVIVQAADDIEPDWDSYSATLDWAHGFGTHTSKLYLNFGSADGCPVYSHNNGGCNNGWNQYDVWFISYGYAPAITAPEIYIDALGRQWAQISQYGAVYQNEAAHYIAPFDENDEDPATFTSDQAWASLTGYMGEPCPYSMQIHTEPGE